MTEVDLKSYQAMLLIVTLAFGFVTLYGLYLQRKVRTLLREREVCRTTHGHYNTKDGEDRIFASNTNSL